MLSKEQLLLFKYHNDRAVQLDYKDEIATEKRLPELLSLKNSENVHKIQEEFLSKLQGYHVRSDLDLKLLKGMFE